jgi:uncharacterized delta-60 repeat protein
VERLAGQVADLSGQASDLSDKTTAGPAGSVRNQYGFLEGAIMKWAGTLLARLFSSQDRTTRSRKSRRASRQARPVLEVLEARIQPATLQVALANHTIVETTDPTATTSATVTRVNTDNTQPMTVSLTSSNNAEVSFPASVVIPANSASTTFNVTAIPDSTPDGTQNVTITGSASIGGPPALDPTFAGSGSIGVSSFPNAVAIQSDGKIVVAAERYNGTNPNYSDFGVSRYNANGTLDTTFAGTGTVATDISGQHDIPHGVVIQSDGKIVVAGTAGNGPHFFWELARYNPDGSLDTTFGSGGKVMTNPNPNGYYNEIWDVTLQADGKILAVGDMDTGTDGDFSVARYNTNGTLDTTFGSGGIAKVDPTGTAGGRAFTAVVQPADGKIILVGTGAGGNYNSTFDMARFTSTGVLDSSFGSGGTVVTNLPGDYEGAQDAVLQPDGKIVVVGSTSPTGLFPPVYNFALARYNANGTLDTTFGTQGITISDFGGNDQAESVALQPDGRIEVVGGGIGATNSASHTIVAWYNSSGSLGGYISSSYIGAQGQDVALQSNGRMVVVSQNLVQNGGYVERYADSTLIAGSDTVAVQDPAGPVAINDSYTTNENTSLTVPAATGVLANDTDSFGAPLTAIQVGNPANGTVTLNGDGSFTYTPNANFSGSDSFTYQDSDGTYTSNVGTVTISVVVPPPVANNDSYSTNENTPLSVAAPGVLTNDTDPNNNPLTAVFATQASHGSVQMASNGAFWYTPATNFYGTDSFTYKAFNGSTYSTPATVTITVNHVNQPPTARSDSYSLNWNSTLTVGAPGILGNDSDPDNDPITAVLSYAPIHGTLTLNSDGSFTYTPTAGYFGYDSFTYRASDGSLTSNLATVGLTVNTTDHAPVAANDSYSMNQGTTLTVAAPGILANDTDADNDPLTAVLAGGGGNPGPFHGSLTLNPNGSFVYTPDPSFTGTDSFNYGAYDGFLYSNVATVSITVNAVPPVAANDSYSVNEDTSLSIAAPGILGNDTPGSVTPITATLVSTVAHGTLSLNSNGSFTYTPSTHFYGTDSFTYRDTEGSVTSNAATVTIAVNFVDHAPVAVNDAYTVNEDSSLNVTIPLGTTSLYLNSQPGDYIGQGQTNTWTPATGAFTVNRNFDNGVSFSYQDTNPNVWWYVDFAAPNNATLVPGLYGNAARFPFQLTSQPGLDIAGEGRGSNTLTGKFTVLQANYSPTGQVLNFDATFEQHSEGATPALFGEIKYNAAATLPGVLSNDTDVDAQALSAILVNGPSHGTLGLNANGTFSYTPNADYAGSDSFTYMANDGTLNSNVATVTLTVNPVNDAPSFVKGSDQTVVEGAGAQTVTGWASAISAGPPNESGQALNFIVSTNNSALFAVAPAIDPATGNLTYTPAPGALGTAIVTVQLHDNGGTANGGVDTSAAQTFNITVNDAVPTFALSGAASVNEGSTYTLGLSAQDPDTITNWTITWGDGSVQTVQGNPSSVNHVFAQGPNQYTISATATDEDGTFAAGNTVGVTVNPVHLGIIGPTGTTAGTPFDITVSALDPLGNVDSGYTGTVHFTSSDALAGLPADYTFTSADGGTHVFTGGATLDTAGTQTLTATDTANTAIAGVLSESVSPAAASQFAIAAPPTSPAGTAFSVTVTALDPFNNLATGYTGTVHFTSSDGQAVLPADSTLTNGSGTFTATLATSGSQSITATDTVTASITGTQSGIAVSPGTATTLLVAGFPSSTTAGTAQTFTVTALDAFGNTATGYSGTVHFASSDGEAVLPADSTLTNGSGMFSATLDTVGTQSITANDTTTTSMTATETGIVVSPAAAARLLVSGPTAGTAGGTLSFTVTAFDAFNNVASGYGGTVHFTSSDGQAGLPADYMFGSGDQGAHTFSVTLRTAGSQSLTATDTATASITGTQGGILISPASAATLVVSGFPSATTAGAAQSFTVTARDAFGNIASGYGGTVHFTSSDGQASLPGDYGFTTGDAGVHTFSATLNTAGSQSISATDTSAQGLNGTEGNIVVSPAAAASALVLGGYPSSTTAGAAHSLTVTAFDAFGNIATGYGGTVHFTSSDGIAALPASYTFSGSDAGVHVFSAAFKAAGVQSITVSDNGALTSTQSGITVGAAAASTLTVAGYPATIAGAANTFTVTLRDVYGNVATGYTGSVHFASSDSQAVLPANYMFTGNDAGTHTFSATFKTAGNQSLTATDTSSSSLTSTQANIAVSPAAASTLSLAGFPSSTTAGVSHSVTVTVRDAFGNVATSYTGTVHFSSSDAQAGLPADYTFNAGDAGVRTFSVTLKTAGTQSLTTTDQATPALTSTQSGLTVTAGATAGFTVSGFVSSPTAGTSHTFTVTARDAYGNLTAGYRGAVHFTSSDAKANIPGDYTFSSGDAGVHTFTGTLKTAGAQSITATDKNTPAITGSQTVTVVAAAATHFSISAPASVTNGVPFTIVVTALDAFGNVATGYTGTVRFTSNDHRAILPSNYTYVSTDNGVHAFTVTLKSGGSHSITATDTSTSSINGNINVQVN